MTKYLIVFRLCMRVLTGIVVRSVCAACICTQVAYEAALLLLRLTSPHTTRAGAVPWRALRGGVAAIGTSGTAADSSDPSLDSSNDDLELAKTAKALCFTPSLLQTR